MRVELWRGDERIHSSTGCNDTYIKHGAVPRMLRLETSLAGQRMTTFHADGIVIATPTGSTAYNLAAGGPIVMPGTESFTIAPLCPHSLTHRPVVCGADVPISICFEGPENAGLATLSVDGQDNTVLERGDVVKIRRAAQELRLVPPARGAFEVLATKLGWSAGR